MIPSSPIAAWLLEASVQGSLAILLVAALAPLLRRWLGAQTSYWLWAFVLFRLIVPGVPTSPIHWSAPSVPQASASWFATARVMAGPEKSRPVASIPSTSTSTARAAFPTQIIGLSIWAIGVALILGFALVRSLRASRLACRARDISHDPRLSTLLRELSLAPSRFRIRETRELRSPALCGLLRPIILLPHDWRLRLGDMELRCVLLHEIGHFQRGDLLWRWAFFLVRAIHWFNPLVWIAVRLARTHQEMACDEWAVSRTSAPSAILYGEALLAISTSINAPGFAFPVQAEMAESKNGLRRRIAHLAAVRPHGWPACTAALLVAISLIAITGPVHSAASKKSVSKSSQDTSSPSATLTAKGISPAKINVKIESKFVQATPGAAAGLFGETTAENSSIGIRAIYSPAQFQGLLRKLDKMKGVDVMSTPSVLMKPKQHATISIVREFKYPVKFDPPTAKQPATPARFEIRPIGIEIEAEPAISSNGRIDIQLSSRLSKFSGFIDYGGSREAMPDLTGDAVAETGKISRGADGAINQPIFSVRSVQTFLSLKDQQTALIGVMNASDDSMISESFAPNFSKSPESSRSLVFVFITATLVGEEDRPAAVAHPAPPPAARKPSPPSATPYGTPVNGKPDFVISPHSPDAGYIDVRGYKPNAEVKDPYSGKIFLVP